MSDHLGNRGDQSHSDVSDAGSGAEPHAPRPALLDTNDAHEGNATPEDDIIEALYAALDRTGALDGRSVTEVARAFPGHESEVRRLAPAVRHYHALTARLGGPGRQPALPPGTHLGDFEIVAFVARGGMAAVYRAVQVSLARRVVALKVVNSGSTTAALVARFRREAEALARLHHPQLAEVFGFGEDQGRLFYAMRFVAGPSLRDLLQRLSRRRSAGIELASDERNLIVRWGHEAAEALAAVHAAGLVHRDVKPSNLMIDGPDSGGDGLPHGHAVLVDFGLVRDLRMDERTLTQLGAGSLPYSAPEQLAGLDTDARSNVFALGVTLHDLLSGQLPEERDDGNGRLPPISRHDPKADADLVAIVAKATEIDPTWRYADARAMADDLAAWLHGEPVRARRPPASERLRRWLARNPRRLLRVAASGALLVILLLVGSAMISASQRVDRAHAALTAADLPLLADALEGLAEPWALLLLHDEKLVAFRRDLMRGDTRDGRSLTAIAQAWRSGDSGQALFLTASRLRVSGPHVEPLLLRSMLTALDSDPAVARESLAHLAQIAYERPAIDSVELLAYRPFRKRMWMLLDEPAWSTDERLLALTALSGCGDSTDPEHLAALALETDGDEEFQRLGLLTAERTLRNSMRRDDAFFIDPDSAVWQRATRWIQRAWDTQLEDSNSFQGNTWDMIEAAKLLERTLILAARRSNAEFEFVKLRSSQWLAEHAVGCPEFLSQTPPVESVFEEPMSSWLERVGIPSLWQDHPRNLGWLIAGVDSPIFKQRVKAEVARRDSTSLAAFEAGIGERVEHERGVVVELELDADTQLGAPDEGGDLVNLPCSRASSEWPKLYKPISGPTLASWRFDASPPEISGQAIGVEATSPRWYDYGEEGYLRLAQPERARLVLAFTVSESAPPMPIALRLLALSPSRTYYPGKGRGALRADLDGTPLGVIGVFQKEIGDGPFDVPLPSRALQPGEHRIQLVLDRQGLGPVWVFGAALVER